MLLRSCRSNLNVPWHARFTREEMMSTLTFIVDAERIDLHIGLVIWTILASKSWMMNEALWWRPRHVEISSDDWSRSIWYLRYVAWLRKRSRVDGATEEGVLLGWTVVINLISWSDISQMIWVAYWRRRLTERMWTVSVIRVRRHISKVILHYHVRLYDVIRV